VDGIRLGVPRALFATDLAPAVAADFEALLGELTREKVTVVDVDLPSLSNALASYYVLACAEAASNLARFDGVAYGVQRTSERWDDTVVATRSDGFGSEVQRRILLGTFVLSAGYYEAYYMRAAAARMRWNTALRNRFARCDLLALPTAATPAFPLGARTGDPLAMYLTDLFTVPASLAGLPAISLPTDLADDGLPLSIQLVGSPLAEDTVLALAGRIERLRSFRRRRDAPWLQ
jgi:aspartyl-tRNA(Asn)/glutamyl-tRNA(Gln) amidotransferase subunit A